MSTTTNVNQIKLNIMTKEQYDSATKSPTELYMVTDADPEGQTIQVDTLPEASESEVGKIYQYVGETDLNYTNGYFYKCFEYESGESGESPYYWEQIEVQPAGSSLPDQTGQSGKFLTTDGTDASWSDKPIINRVQGTGNSGIIAIASSDMTYGNYNGASIIIGSGNHGSGYPGVVIGNNTKITASSAHSVAIGNASQCGYDGSVVVGASSTQAGGYGNGSQITIGSYCQSSGTGAIVIGSGSSATAKYAIQIGRNATNSDTNTFKVANQNGNYEMMSADGTIPADRLPNSINKYSTMPTAASGNLGWIVQYTGTTDANYTHGYLYECVSDGAATPTYSWTAVQVQAGGSSLPSQTGKTGQVLTTDGTNASWTTKALKNVASHSESIIVGPSANVTTTDGGQNAVLGEYAILASTSVRGATIVGSGKEGGEVLAGWYSTAIGNKAHAGGATEATQSNAIAIGSYAKANSLGSIQLGYGTNNDANTLKVGQQINNQWQNYELLSAGGTIPTDRFTTTPSSAGSYVPTITVDGQGAVTRSWTTPSGGASMSYDSATKTLTIS